MHERHDSIIEQDEIEEITEIHRKSKQEADIITPMCTCVVYAHIESGQFSTCLVDDALSSFPLFGRAWFHEQLDCQRVLFFHLF